MKSFRCDADDRVLNAIKDLSSANDVRVAAVTIFPRLITDHRHWMRVAPCAFFRSESAAENRLDPECVEIICGDNSPRRTFGAIAHTQGRAHDPIDDERLEEGGAFFKVEELGIGEPGIPRRAAGGGVQREHPVLVRNQRIRSDQNSFDPTEHGGVRSDAESQTQNRERTETGSAPKHPRAEAQVLPELVRRKPDALFAGRFLNLFETAEFAPRRRARRCRIHPLVDLSLGQELEMRLHLCAHLLVTLFLLKQPDEPRKPGAKSWHKKLSSR